MTELCQKCGEPIHARYHMALRMCPRHARERLMRSPPFACTPADLTETGDEGHLGLLTVLVNAGWRVYAPIRERGSVLYAASDSYVRGESGTTEKDAAVKLFSALYSDEPDAIACAAAFWPPSPVSRLDVIAPTAGGSSS